MRQAIESGDKYILSTHLEPPAQHLVAANLLIPANAVKAGTQPGDVAPLEEVQDIKSAIGFYLTIKSHTPKRLT